MKQTVFEQRYEAEWEAFERTVTQLEKRRPLAERHFDASYRRLCQQVALAQTRGYSPYLVDRLQQLALRAHQQFYRHRSHLMADVLGFIAAGFPRTIRKEWRLLLLSSLFFYGSLLIMGLLAYAFPDVAYSLIGSERISEMESMYDPAASEIGPMSQRDTSDNWIMFAYYIMNNIGIAFQTFAGGIVFGLGSLFFLVYNGLFIGGIAGHLTRIGYDQTFWSFVIGHGAYELTAITIAGAAGLKLGWALLSPGQLLRSEALRRAGGKSIRLMGGAILLLLLAAFIEAYWSSINTLPVWIKYSVGAALWLSLGGYFGLAGRRRHEAD